MGAMGPRQRPTARLNEEKEATVPVPSNRILFRNVTILDSTGAEPYPGDVLVDDDRIAAVGSVDPSRAEGARVIEGRGRTLMSGLCDAHTHFTWNNSADLDGLGTMPVEEHRLWRRTRTGCSSHPASTG
jgi:imidazolonepropionase-like amidohydrolase